MTARAVARAARLALGALAALALGAASLQAQGLGLGGNDDKPLEVLADQGIEWHQNENKYVARGNARATKGDTTVFGDRLTAHYRKAANGGTEIWRVEADGNVRITSPNETAFGERAVYTVDNGVLVMTGKNLRLDTPREKISARDSLEYWQQQDLAVARGDAVVITDDGRRIRADVLTARFKPAEQPGAQPAAAKPNTAKAGTAKPSTNKPTTNKPETKPAGPGQKPAQRGAAAPDNSRLNRLDAYGNVIITTPEEVARGDRGVYIEETGIANLIGSVKITRGQNQLNGEAAEVNLRTGVSRIVSAKPGTGGPVRALIVPERKPEDAAAPPSGGTPGRSVN